MRIRASLPPARWCFGAGTMEEGVDRRALAEGARRLSDSLLDPDQRVSSAYPAAAEC